MVDWLAGFCPHGTPRVGWTGGLNPAPYPMACTACAAEAAPGDATSGEGPGPFAVDDTIVDGWVATAAEAMLAEWAEAWPALREHSYHQARVAVSALIRAGHLPASPTQSGEEG